MASKENTYRLITEWLFDGVFQDPEFTEKQYDYVVKSMGIESTIETKLAVIGGLSIGVITGMEIADQAIQKMARKDTSKFELNYSFLDPIFPIIKRRILEIKDAFLKERLEK